MFYFQFCLQFVFFSCACFRLLSISWHAAHQWGRRWEWEAFRFQKIKWNYGCLHRSSDIIIWINKIVFWRRRKKNSPHLPCNCIQNTQLQLLTVRLIFLWYLRMSDVCNENWNECIEKRRARRKQKNALNELERNNLHK